MTALPVADSQRCELPTSSGRPCRRDRNCGWHGRPEYYEVRRQAYERWAAGERPRHIAAEWGVTSREVRYWVEWYRRRLPAEEADYPAYLRRRRRWMLELRNAGHSYAEIGQRYGIGAQTALHGVRQAGREVGADEQVVEPVLDWLRQRLAAEPSGLAPETLYAEVDAVMRHPVCRKLLRDKLLAAGWQVRGGVLCRLRPTGLQAASNARWRARRQEILARRHAGESEDSVAEAYGITVNQVRSTVVRARAEAGGQALMSELPGGRRALVAGQVRRRRALELRNAGAPRSYVGEQLGVSVWMVTRLANLAACDAMSSDPERAGEPVAEPLLEWLAKLPGDWAGMPSAELAARASAAMGHPVERQALWRKLMQSDWCLRSGRLVRRVADAPAALAMRAVA